MKLISNRESEIGNLLNSKRGTAIVDIYKETDFSGLGYLIDDQLVTYKYLWNIGFDNKNHNFGKNFNLYQLKRNLKKDQLLSFLNDLDLSPVKYPQCVNENEAYCEIIRLPHCAIELENEELFDIIRKEVDGDPK